MILVLLVHLVGRSIKSLQKVVYWYCTSHICSTHDNEPKGPFKNYVVYQYTYSGGRLRIDKAPFMIWNEVTLTGQNLPLECCYPLKILTQFLKRLDLLMLKIRALVVKGLQSYRPSNFENDSTPRKLDWFEWARGQVAGFSWDLQLWQLVTMQPFNLQSPNFQHQKI